MAEKEPQNKVEIAGVVGYLCLFTFFVLFYVKITNFVSMVCDQEMNGAK